MLRTTDRGLYCEAGDFYIDPWAPVARAVVTHAHGDHLTWGCDAYLVTEAGAAVSRERLGTWAAGLEGMPYGATRSINGVTVSFHPAGHILGSAQVRLEYRGEVWVVREGKLVILRPRPIHVSSGRVYFESASSGLAVGDRVVTSQLANPRAGMAVSDAEAAAVSGAVPEAPRADDPA